MARSASGARNYLLWGGLLYLLLWLSGLLIAKEPGGGGANFVPLNTADDWFHLFLGVAMVGWSFLDRGTTRGTAHAQALRPLVLVLPRSSPAMGETSIPWTKRTRIPR